MDSHPADPRLRRHKGRGAVSNDHTRFAAWSRAPDADWCDENEAEPGPSTTVREVHARSIISHNQSPDIPFDQSLNPYQGCEHSCIYCYARPTHAWLDLSPGLDFETKLFAKSNAATLLRAEFARPGYRVTPLALGANTDPYQPIERRLRLSRALLEVLEECRHPVTITTKSALVERDIDVLGAMAERGLARVHLSIGTLDHGLARVLEPRATAPMRRIETIRRLSAAGIPVDVLCAPVIPAINDAELEQVLEAAATAGARRAGYVVLRLPLEVRDLFAEWLEQHFPQRAEHVLSLVRQMRDGRDNDPRFGTRMRGTGQFADLISQRFRLAARRLGLERERGALDVSQFRPPAPAGQLSLF